MKPQNSAELLRNRVEAAVADRGRRRALMRAMGLRSQGTITQWLNGEHNPSVEKLDSIAKFLGCTVSELFLPVTTSVLDQNAEAGVDSLPHKSQGGAHGAEVVALRAEILHLRNDIAGTAELLTEITERLTTLASGEVAHGRVQRTGTHKPKRR